LAIATLETLLMPVFLLVGEVLGVCTDGCLALLAGVGKQILIALDTVGMILSQDVTMSS
jgi:hypothetical protein